MASGKISRRVAFVGGTLAVSASAVFVLGQTPEIGKLDRTLSSRAADQIGLAGLGSASWTPRGATGAAPHAPAIHNGSQSEEFLGSLSDGPSQDRSSNRSLANSQSDQSHSNQIRSVYSAASEVGMYSSQVQSSSVNGWTSESDQGFDNQSESRVISATFANTVPQTAEGKLQDPVLVLYGPVMDLQASSLNVLGQDFQSELSWSAPVDAASSVGRVAYVEGRLGDSGFEATRVELFEEYSIPGATTVFVYGQLDSADPSVGLARIGELQLDVTSIPSEGYLVSQNVVAVPGVQPLPDGVILGYDQLIADENLLAALSTSEVLSISGSSLRSISGSSLKSISGSSLRSISGSSLKSISGSSLRSISGSSLKSISGSSLR